MKTLFRVNSVPASNPGKETRSGAAMVEMAVVMPLFMMIILGIVEFGRAMMVANLMTNAAREGARLAIVSGVTNTEVQNAVIQQVQETVNVTIPAANVTISIAAYPNGSAVAGANLATAQKRDLIIVEAKVAYSQVALSPVRFLTGINLRGQAAMRHE